MNPVHTLHYAGIPADGFGWGICNKNMLAHLAEYFALVPASETPDFCFMPLADHDFNPATPARGRLANIAYTFFEYPLGPNAKRNAERYDVVFCGSQWCLDKMKEAGITNGRVLWQGVDFEIFKPGIRDPDGKIRIFSGGKFEWRKGQDLVVAAFSEFVKVHPHAELVCAWHNPWPQLILNMAGQSGALINLRAHGDNQEQYFEAVLLQNGLLPAQFKVLPKLSQAELAKQMRQTDFGLFPNRCEGGTNLVLMEYLACGRPAIANLGTGQADLLGCRIKPIRSRTTRAGWAESTVDDVLSAMLTWWTFPCGDEQAINRFSWEEAAGTAARAFVEAYWSSLV